MCLCSCTPCEGIHAQVTSQGGGGVSQVNSSLALCGQVGEVAEAEQEQGVQDPGDVPWPHGKF